MTNKPRKPTKPSSAILRRTVLLVDDHDDLRLATKWFLSNLGYRVEAVRSAEEALGIFDPSRHDLVVTDNSMPGMSGAELAHMIKTRSPGTPVVMHTGLAPADTSCVDVLLRRPCRLLALQEAVGRLLRVTPAAPPTKTPQGT